MAEHSEILPRLCAYHDGALSDAERDEIEEHVQGCAACQFLLADWTALDDALLELDLPEPDAGVIVAGVLSRIAVSERQPDLLGKTSRSIWTGRRLALGSAAAVLMLAVGIGFWQRAGEPPSVPHELADRTQIGGATEEKQSGLPATTVGTLGEEAPLKAEGTGNEAETESKDASLHAEAKTPELAAIAKPRPASHALNTAAPKPIRPEDTGIPQVPGGPARPVFDIDIHYRLYDQLDIAYVELNLVPVFEVEFTPVGYALANKLEGQWDATNTAPLLLDPEQAYLVSNLRIERATLLALVINQAPTSDLRLRLAEVTWRLANITADRDDVRSAISAQTEAMRQLPGSATELRGRLAFLRGLVR